MTKIAAVQFCAGDDTERALKKAGQFVEAAAAKGVRVACFAELFAWPWFPNGASSEPFVTAEPLGGPVTSAVSELAARHSIALVCPFFEKDDDSRYYNSAVVFDKNGNAVGVYRKVHVPDLAHWQEKHYFTGGEEFNVFEVEGLKVGVQLGWDNFFPEGFRSLALAGADAVFLPSAAAFASSERWLAMAVSHAIANGIYVVRVNRVGKEGNLDFYGESFCVRPDGELTVEPLGLNDGLLIAECDHAHVEQARRMWPYMNDRTPRLYGSISGAHAAPVNIMEKS